MAWKYKELCLILEIDCVYLNPSFLYVAIIGHLVNQQKTIQQLFNNKKKKIKKCNILHFSYAKILMVQVFFNVLIYLVLYVCKTNIFGFLRFVFY